MNAIAPAPKPWEAFPPLPRLPDLRDEIKAYPFQDWTLAKSASQPVFAIGAATGLGKTFMSWETFKRIRHEWPRTRFLVLTNKSACLQFAAEHEKFYSSELRVSALHNRMEKLGRKKYADTRSEAIRRFGSSDESDALDTLVMNYALLRLNISEIQAAAANLVAAGYRVVVCPDEATAFKNRATAVHRCINDLVHQIKPGPAGGKILILTATLTKGKLEECYNIFCGVELGHVIAKDWEDFLATFCICAAARRAMVPREKLEQVYYFIAQNELDGRTILGLRMFKTKFNIVYKNGLGQISKADLDAIRLICSRDPGFRRQVPDLATFYARLEVKFEDKEVKEEPIITGYRNLDLFIERIAPYVVILTKSDASKYLPSFVPKKVMLEHSDEQVRLIRDIYNSQIQLGRFTDWRGDMSDDDLIEVEGRGGVIPVERLTEQGHIRRALLDPRLVHKLRLDDLSAKAYAPKTEELLRFLRDEATGERVIVYTPSKAHLKLLSATLRAAGGLEDYYADPLEIHGDINALDRERNRRLFQESELHRLILINDAGIESINLQSASILYVFGLPRSGGDMVQLAGRPSRLGSLHSSILLIYSLIADSQDEDDYDVVQKQMWLISLVQGEAEKGLLDHNRLRELDGVDDGASSDDYRRASLAHLTLSRRARRVRSYGAALP